MAETEQADTIPGFQKPQEPQDEWTARLFQKHGLGGSASLEQVEPVAKKLLGDPRTIIEAAELVLGRRVGAQEDVLKFLMTPALNADEKFGVLLMEKDIDRMKKEQAQAPN